MIKESFASTEGDDTSVDQSRRNFLKHMVAGVVLATAEISAESKEGKVAEGSPFDPEVQKDALQFVAQKMNVVVEGGGPNVVVSESISDEDFNKLVGFDTGGKRTNLFYPPNTIYLTSNSEAHNLVHEYVHYIQYKYNGVTDGTSDVVEDEAVRIQNLFRERKQ